MQIMLKKWKSPNILEYSQYTGKIKNSLHFYTWFWPIFCRSQIWTSEKNENTQKLWNFVVNNNFIYWLRTNLILERGSAGPQSGPSYFFLRLMSKSTFPNPLQCEFRKYCNLKFNYTHILLPTFMKSECSNFLLDANRIYLKI